MELRRETWILPVQLGLEVVPEQVVVAIPGTGAVEGHDQHVPALEHLEDLSRALHRHHLIAQCTAHGVEDRGPHQEFDPSRCQPPHHLESQVVDDNPVIASRADRLVGRHASFDRERYEVEAGWPSLGSCHHIGEVRPDIDLGSVEEGAGFSVEHREVVRPHLEQPAPESKRSHLHGWFHPRTDDEGEAGRDTERQFGHDVPRGP